jgi:hypothetical protein
MTIQFPHAKLSLFRCQTFAFAILIALITFPVCSIAKPLPPASSQTKTKENGASKGLAKNQPTALPAKKKTSTKTTRIDFSESDGVVIAPRNSGLNKAINQAETQQRTQEVQVRSRLFVPAPPGDQSEILSSNSSPVAAQTEKPAQDSASKTASQPVSPPVSQQISGPITQRISAAPEPAPSPTPGLPPTQATMAPTPQSIELLNVEAKPPVEDLRVAESPSPASKAMAPLNTSTLTTHSTLAFFRTGYLHAHYKKFDDRMKDGATSIGLGVARGFDTSWGEFEARASLDVYHAMDQTVTVDHVRMFATRTEVAYWITKARVRPALTFGLGWADYAVKSYRSVKTDGQGDLVTLRTHAKSQAFTVIPGTALRIQLNDEIVIDTQTEFLGLLGGDSADAVQGLAFGLSLGWVF